MLSKCRKCHFRDPKFKYFLAENPPGPPYICHHFVGAQMFFSHRGPHTRSAATATFYGVVHTENTRDYQEPFTGKKEDYLTFIQKIYSIHYYHNRNKHGCWFSTMLVVTLYHGDRFSLDRYYTSPALGEKKCFTDDLHVGTIILLVGITTW